MASAPVFLVQGNAVMTAADEQQYAFTAHQSGGPLAPLSIRTQWAAAGFTPLYVPHYLIGSFVAPGPWAGWMDISLAALTAWGGDRRQSATGAGGLSFFLADTTVFHLPRPPYGPDPFVLGVPGVVSPSNYPTITCCGIINVTPNVYLGNGYALGYQNDAVGPSYGLIAPAAPWSYSGPINDGLITAYGATPSNGGWPGLLPNPIFGAPDPPLWPLVQGRTYAIYAVPQGMIGPAYNQGLPYQFGGGGYEDYPAFSATNSHFDIPNVSGFYPFEYPGQDPPLAPAGWPPFDSADATAQGWTPRWKIGHDTGPGEPWNNGGIPIPAGQELYHYRTGQRFHIEATGITVSGIPYDCLGTCPADMPLCGPYGLCTGSCPPGFTDLHGQCVPGDACTFVTCPPGTHCVNGNCVPDTVSASGNNDLLWLLLAAGAATAIAVADKQRNKRHPHPHI